MQRFFRLESTHGTAPMRLPDGRLAHGRGAAGAAIVVCVDGKRAATHSGTIRSSVRGAGRMTRRKACRRFAALLAAGQA